MVSVTKSVDVEAPLSHDARRDFGRRLTATG